MLEQVRGSKPAEMANEPFTGEGTPDSPAEPLAYVVDDEPLVAQVVADMLEAGGLHPVVFHNPLTAYKTFFAAHPRPKLLVTDYVMNWLNGMELIAQCKQAEPGLKTILFSGNVDHSITSRYAVQPDRFFSKPLQLDSLVETARNLIQA
jgi:DNA-binding NtrC family response regulator